MLVRFKREPELKLTQPQRNKNKKIFKPKQLIMDTIHSNNGNLLRCRRTDVWLAENLRLFGVAWERKGMELNLTLI
jgi:hypothetical protein